MPVLARPAVLLLLAVAPPVAARPPAGRSSSPAAAISVAAGPGRFDPLPANADLPAGKLLVLLPARP